MSLDSTTSFSLEESDFYRLFGALCVKSEQLVQIARLRQIARLVGAVALVVLIAGFVTLTSGADRFPDFVPLVVPALLLLASVVAHAVAGRRFRQAALIFKALFHEDDPSYPVLYRIKFRLETDQIFDLMRREGFSLTWDSALEECEGAAEVNQWLSDTLGQRLAA